MLSRFSYWRLCSIRNMFCTLLLISLCAALHVWTLDVILGFTDNMRSAISSISFFTKFEPDANTKYILSWDHKYLTSNVTDRFQDFHCSIKNCLFTTNKNLLHDLTAFDAIIFSENILDSTQRPEPNPRQIFVFMSMESSYKYPACELHNDNYFNWTFTYRFDSDILWRQFVVRDASGYIVAPSAHVVWTTSSAPLKPKVKSILRSKTKEVVWIVGDCSTESYNYLLRLQNHLYHFALKVHKYKPDKSFKKSNLYSNILDKTYQFVLVFENSKVEDYVSNKVMGAYSNYAVPVVYGGANYSRFLPPGSYINACELHPYNLAQIIHEATKKQSVFESYFKWTNVYSIEESGTKHSSLCDLCAALHGEQAKDAPAKKNFRTWWNSNNMHRCLPSEYMTVDKIEHTTNDEFILL